MRGEMSITIRECVVGLVLLVFSLLTLFYFIPTQIELTEEYAMRSLSPSFYPELSAWIIAFLGMLLIVRSFRKRSQTSDEEGTSMGPKEELRVGIAFFIALFFAFCFTYLGFLLATFLALILFFILQGIRGLLKLFFLSGGATVFVYLFFQYIMKVHFPPGLWVR
jgi:hypothetical protein